MESNRNGPEVPMGLAMALARDLDAMQVFSALPPAKQREIVEETHRIYSAREMDQLVLRMRQGRF